MRLSTLLRLSFMVSAAAENPLNRIFMMKKKANHPPGGAAETCVDPDALQTALTDLQAAVEAKETMEQEKATTVTQIDALQKELESLRVAAAGGSEDPGAAVRAALTERDEALARLNRVMHELKDTKAEHEARMTEIRSSSQAAERVASVQEDFAKRLAELQSKSDRELVAAVARANKKDDEIEKLKSQLVLMEQKLGDTNSVANAELQARIKQLESEKESISGQKTAFQAMYKALEMKYEAILAKEEGALEEEVLKRLVKETSLIEKRTEEKWSEKFEALKESSAKELADVKAKGKEDLKKLSSAHASEIETLNSRHKKEAEAMIAETRKSLVTEAEGVATSLKAKVQDLQKELTTTKEALTLSESAKSDLLHSAHLLEIKYMTLVENAKYWESAFEKRSYLNLTHVAEGAAGLMAPTQQVLTTFAAPLTEMYEKKMKSRVDEIVGPVWDKAAVALAKGKKQAQETADAAFNTLVSEFETTCPIFLSTFKGINGVPEELTSALEESCRHPNEQVASFLDVLTLLTVVLFGHKLIWATLKVLWFFCPLRLLLPAKRGTRGVQLKTEKKAVNGAHTSKNGRAKAKK